MAISFTFTTNSDGSLDSNYPNGDKPASATGSTVPLTLDLGSDTDNGRFSFYMMQSELTSTGTHVFWIQRTHGTNGAVTVDYASSGDTHTTVSGTLSWADNDCTLKAVQVNVPSKDPGDHRILMTLSNPTGGAVLHNGTDTTAFGVIDDGTIATSNAIFLDAYAATDGSGTEGSPYNNWTSVRNNMLSTTRYVYIKNYLNPSETGSGATAPSGTGDQNHFEIKGTSASVTDRSSEANRLYIRSWPGFSGGIDGTKDRSGGTITESTTNSGFKFDDDADDQAAYITIRKLDFLNINSTGASNQKAYGIRIKANGTAQHNRLGVERCTFNGMTSSATSSTAAVFGECQSGGTGHYVWGCTFDDQLNDNGGDTQWGIEYFHGRNIQCHKNTFSTSCRGIYEKETPTALEVGYHLSHNLFNVGVMEFSSQAARTFTNYHLIQGNLWDSATTPTGETQPIRFDGSATAGGPHNRVWITNNVLYDRQPEVIRTRGVIIDAPIEVQNAILFNNIVQDHRVMTRFDVASNEPLYQDHNCYFQDTQSGNYFEYNGASYASLAAHVAGTTFDDNSIDTDPQFTNPAGDDFTLGGSSPCTDAGLSGTDMGLYLTGDEKPGSSTLQTNTVV